MLERAGACLKAGARDSLKCASAVKKAARSQLQLHQTFWSHGAGDLGLPPYAISNTPPHDLPLRHDSTTGRSKRVARSQKSNVSSTACLGPGAVIGEESVIGDRTLIRSSVVGRNCRIGSDCVIQGAYVWDNVTIDSYGITHHPPPLPPPDSIPLTSLIPRHPSI